MRGESQRDGEIQRQRQRQRGRQGSNNDNDDVTPKKYCAYQRDMVGGPVGCALDRTGNFSIICGSWPLLLILLSFPDVNLLTRL